MLTSWDNIHIGCPLLHMILYNPQLLIGCIVTLMLLDFITRSTSNVVMVICNCNPLQLFIVELVSWDTTTIIVALQCQLRTITCNDCMLQSPFLCFITTCFLAKYKRCFKRKILTNLQPHLPVLTALNNTLTISVSDTLVIAQVNVIDNILSISNIINCKLY